VKLPGSLRASEWLLIVYFSYVALIGPFYPLVPGTAWRPAVVVFILVALMAALAYGEKHEYAEPFSMARDWLAVGLTLVAYREMDWFSALDRNFLLELHWVQWDRSLLYTLGLQRTIELFGALLPSYLELCYLLVYAVAPATVAMIYIERRRDVIDRVLFLYLAGTLLAYALFPYFPSDPPRTVFGGSDMPNIMTGLRRFNLWIVNGYGIHSSVFPSAHVSSAFSAAWALLYYMPEKRRFGRGMLIYAVSVSIATVYGRYHYAADAAAGLIVSLAAAGFTTLVAPRRPLRPHDLPSSL
jgi:membrane-associated phospholipid phosphatase